MSTFLTYRNMYLIYRNMYTEKILAFEVLLNAKLTGFKLKKLHSEDHINAESENLTESEQEAISRCHLTQ